MAVAIYANNWRPSHGPFSWLSDACNYLREVERSGSGESEHFALAWPIERNVIGASKLVAR